MIKYTLIWFKMSSDKKLEAEREKLRLRWCKGDASVERLLRKFDNEMLIRMNKKWDKEHRNDPPKESRHKEHGYHLFEDD